MSKYCALSDLSIEGVPYKVGAVIECSEALAKPLCSQGLLDGDKAAVSAREDAGIKAIKHVKPNVESAASIEARDAEKR